MNDNTLSRILILILLCLLIVSVAFGIYLFYNVQAMSEEIAQLESKNTELTEQIDEYKTGYLKISPVLSSADAYIAALENAAESYWEDYGADVMVKYFTDKNAYYDFTSTSKYHTRVSLVSQAESDYESAIEKATSNVIDSSLSKVLKFLLSH